MPLLTSVTFAVSGYGQAATLLHESLRAQPDVACRWVIGHRPVRAAAFAAERGIPNHSTDLRDALEDDAVDLVVICTPNELHYEQALVALQAGKHVIVEVPMTMNDREAQRLVDAAGERKVMLSVPHVARYLNSSMRAKELMDTGEVGRIFQVIYRRLWLHNQASHWAQIKRSWTDSVSWHHAAHAVDLIMWLLGEPLDGIGAIVGRDRASGNTVDLSANFVTPSDAIVTLLMSYNAQREVFDCLIVGQQGMLELEGFSLLRLNGAALVKDNPDTLLNLEKAYQRYAASVTAHLRGEEPAPVAGAEILPVMTQLQRMHEMADGFRRSSYYAGSPKESR